MAAPVAAPAAARAARIRSAEPAALAGTVPARRAAVAAVPARRAGQAETVEIVAVRAALARRMPACRARPAVMRPPAPKVAAAVAAVHTGRSCQHRAQSRRRRGAMAEMAVRGWETPVY